MFRACVWMQGWSAQGTKWGINRCCSGFLKDPQRAFDECHKHPVLGGSVQVIARSRAMPRWVCADCCRHSSNFALRSFCGSETLSHKTPAATRSNAAAREQAFRLITCLRMLRTKKALKYCTREFATERPAANSTAYCIKIKAACKFGVSLPQQPQKICNFGFTGLAMVKLPEKRLSLQVKKVLHFNPCSLFFLQLLP